MALEIERKFLVKNLDFKKKSFAAYHLKQGYISFDKNATVRIRITDEKAFITIKGKSNKNGTSRFEWEKEIDILEANSLFNLCKEGIIEKQRFLVKNGNFTFEVDEFYGENEGLILAEIELKNENDFFDKPSWLGNEVTGNKKYYNALLSKLPFKKWQ